MTCSVVGQPDRFVYIEGIYPSEEVRDDEDEPVASDLMIVETHPVCHEPTGLRLVITGEGEQSHRSFTLNEVDSELKNIFSEDLNEVTFTSVDSETKVDAFTVIIGTQGVIDLYYPRHIERLKLTACHYDRGHDEE
jgi:hypothetical protein